MEIWPLILQMEIDSSTTGEEKYINKGQEEEVGTSGAGSPTRKKQKTVSSEAEVIGEE